MPLCPTCVVEHTEEHYECNQKPTYVNLHDALQESKQKCYANIVKLEEFNRKNVILLQLQEVRLYVLLDYSKTNILKCNFSGTTIF